MAEGFDPQLFIISITVILLSLAVHEYAHAKFADLAGDPTPRYFGRVTMNPLNHLDPIGTIMIILSSLAGFGIGWGKPVPMDPRKMRNPRWDHFVAVAAGPLSNLLQACVYAIVLRLMILAGSTSGNLLDMYSGAAGAVATFLVMGVFINLGLFFFNLIPLGPLDGHWLVGTFLPEPQRTKWYQFNRTIGGFIFIILILMKGDFDIIGRVMMPLVMRSAAFLLGV